MVQQNRSAVFGGKDIESSARVGVNLLASARQPQKNLFNHLFGFQSQEDYKYFFGIVTTVTQNG
ncbi:MAG: hypothetical protein CMQ39_04170 [Gammaproteobacteria bacterium]|nr:hypothetical protein [Gammaproteobacteria bacterium]